MSTHAQEAPVSPPAELPRPRRQVIAGAVAVLVALAVLPVAALTIPNTLAYVLQQAVQDLGLPDGRRAELVRFGGYALPALLLTVPLAAVAVRKFPVRVVLPAGMLCVLAGGLAGHLAAAAPLVGAARAAQGVGAGLVVPATLVVVWERRRRGLVSVWAGLLAAALLLATPLALHAIPAAAVTATVPGAGWRAVLWPYPLLTGIALAITGLYAIARFRRAEPLPALRHTERTQLLLPVVPAAGFAFLAVATTADWSPGAQLVAAGIGLAALLGLALMGSRDSGTGSPLGLSVVMLTAGLLGMPVVTPLAGLLGTGPGPHAVPLEPFAAAAAAALAGALVAGRLPFPTLRGAVLTGHGLLIIAVLVLLTTDATAGRWPLLAPLVALGAGLGLALAAAFRGAGLGAALFGLALGFPALLTGQFVALILQSAQVQRLQRLGVVIREDQLVYALTAGYRIWLVVAGALAVLLAAAAGLAGRPGRPGRHDRREGTGRPGRPGTSAEPAAGR